MTIANPGTLFTPDDLLRMEDAVNYELVDGKLVERHMGMESSEIALRIAFLLALFLRDRRTGRLFGADASYQCFPAALTKIRKPDVSFIPSDRIPGGKLPAGHCPIAPGLAVEVVSPGDLAYEVEEKVAEYLEAGVPLVWIVNPPTRTVRVRRPKTSNRGPVAELSGEDLISGEDVLPGFSCKVSEFFTVP
jgi:Uma2 family endonuclease